MVESPGSPDKDTDSEIKKVAAFAPLTYGLVALVSRAFSASTDIAGLSR